MTEIKDIPLTDDEIFEMTSIMMPSSTWEKAFNFYNSETGEKLQMSCRPCYNKVLVYILRLRIQK